MKNKMYKKHLFLLIGSIVLIGQSGNLNADSPNANMPIVGAINPPDGSTIIMFATMASIPGPTYTFTSPAPDINNLYIFCTKTLQNIHKNTDPNNRWIFANMSEYGTKLNIYADAACTQWLGSFQMSETNLIQTIAWNAKDSTGAITGGSFNTTKQAQNNAGLKGAGSVFAISLGGQGMLKVLPFSQKGYQVYDIYMAAAPSTMTVGGSNVDISTITKPYSYATPSDGPLFMFQSTICYDVNSYNGCTNCSINTKFAIDGVPITLPSLPTNDAWNLFVIVRVHVGQAPDKAPGLPSTIPNTSPTMDLAKSTINLNGNSLSGVELSSDNKTWYFVPINRDFKDLGAYYACYLLDTLCINIGGKDGTVQTKFGYGNGSVFVRINKIFMYSNPIVTIKNNIGMSPTFFYIKQ